MPPSLTFAREGVISKIENLLEAIVDGIFDCDNGAQLAITLRTRSGVARRQRHGLEDLNFPSPPKTQDICYPGSTAQDAWRFSMQSSDPYRAPANVL
jgi:meiotic recombination protein SPO11